MKITIINEESFDQRVETYDNVLMVEFENQEHLGNGQWLHIYKKNEQFSISFDPKSEWFTIKEN